MNTVFYVSGAVAIFCTAMAITRLNGVHALLWVMVSLLAVALDFYVLGAPYVAVLEVIIYAGAIVVLFVFVVMLLNLGERGEALERQWLSRGVWAGPSVVACVLVAEVIYLVGSGRAGYGARPVEPKQVGIAMFGPYVIGVELISTLLLAGLVAAYHLGWHSGGRGGTRDGIRSHGARAGAGGDLVRLGSDRPAGAP